MSLPIALGMTDLKTLRQQLKQARRDLPAILASEAQNLALQRLQRLPAYRRARRIAAYFGSNGELDPRPMLESAQRERKSVHLPVLHPFKPGRLWFGRWQQGDQLVPNRYGIPEPLPGRTELLPPRHLDLVIVPLLGFDEDCHRLGMGGGYYDRTFAFLNRHKRMQRPKLIGLAYDIQCVSSLHPQPWDIQLDAVVTPSNIHWRNTT